MANAKRPAARKASQAEQKKITSQSSFTEIFSNWEMKDRRYVLVSKATPVSFQLRSRHTEHQTLTFFDEEMGYPRALRYVTNQNTFFMDEQVEPFNLGVILFEDGELRVPAQQTVLQKFLAIHPDNQSNKEDGRGGIFKELDVEQIAKQSLEREMAEHDALGLIFTMSPEDLEAVARVVLGSKIDSMDSYSVRRDLVLKAKEKGQAEEIIRLANDPVTKNKNIAKRAIDANLIKLNSDGMTVVWGDTGETICVLQASTDFLDSFAKYMRTDHGMTVLDQLLHKLR